MSTILTSLHGKKVGLDVNGRLTTESGAAPGTIYLGGSDVEKRAFGNSFTSATISSTGTNIDGGGLTVITATGAKAYVIDDPVGVGQVKRISQTSSSTAAKTVTTAGGAGVGFDGLNHILTFLGRGDSVQLESISTAMWALTGKSGTVTATTV